MNITALQIKEAIRLLLTDPDNRLGGNLLGTYMHESGLIDPAIAIGNPPSDIKITGLECLLPIFPDTRSEWAGVSIHSEETWDILLIQRDVAPGQFFTIHTAAHRLRCFFATSEGAYMPQDDLLGSYPQYRVTFTRSDLHPIINKVISFCTT